MSDSGAEYRHLIEGVIDQQLDAAAARRGWDLGGQAQAAQLSTSGAGLNDQIAQTFATGYDGTVTTLGFTFDISLLDGPDQLV